MTRRRDRQPASQPPTPAQAVPDTSVDLGGASTLGVSKPGKMTGLRPPQLARRRKAPPHPGARHSGPYTAVSLTARMTRGNGYWVEVTTSTGQFYVNFDAALLDVVQQIIGGGHWVR